MCLPLLYANVSLVHHPGVRISRETGRPVGCGGATPFFMGLNALVTKNVAQYVRSLEIKGEWKKKGEAGEREDMESAKMGLVPDGHMMLSLLVRTAIERCPNLEAFSWDLDTKMLPTVWAGLCQKPGITHISVRMPSTRAPMPVCDVPPIPSLKSLSVYDIDPLCYPDSLSSLLYGSKQLEHLKLHWSPRMRREREPSTNIQAYFGKCLARKYSMTLKSFAMQNLYSISGGDFGGIVDSSTIESYCLLSSMPGENDSADIAFVGYSWQWAPPSPLRMPNLKQLRGDKISRRHVTVLAAFTGLQRYYLASGRKLEDRPFDERAMPPPKSQSPQSPEASTPGLSEPDTPTSPNYASPADSNSNSVASASQNERSLVALGPAYLEAATLRHGPTLQHLLLMPHWRLSPEDLQRLVRAAPKLEQLAVGVDVGAFAALSAANQREGQPLLNLLGAVLRTIQPFARNLKAIRLLDSPKEEDVSDEVAKVGGDEAMEDRIAKESWGKEFDGLRWVGLGDYVFEVRTFTQRSTPIKGRNEPKAVRRVKRRPLKSVFGSRGVEIWRMDRLTLAT